MSRSKDVCSENKVVDEQEGSGFLMSIFFVIIFTICLMFISFQKSRSVKLDMMQHNLNSIQSSQKEENEIKSARRYSASSTNIEIETVGINISKEHLER